MMKKAAGYLPPDVGVSSQSSSQQSELGAAAAGSKREEQGPTGNEELDLQSMVYGMKSFVDMISSHEGAEFPWYIYIYNYMRPLQFKFNTLFQQVFRKSM